MVISYYFYLSFIYFCKTTESTLTTSAALAIAVRGLALYSGMLNFQT